MDDFWLFLTSKPKIFCFFLYQIVSHSTNCYNKIQWFASVINFLVYTWWNASQIKFFWYYHILRSTFCYKHDYNHLAITAPFNVMCNVKYSQRSTNCTSALTALGQFPAVPHIKVDNFVFDPLCQKWVSLLNTIFFISMCLTQHEALFVTKIYKVIKARKKEIKKFIIFRWIQRYLWFRGSHSY